MFLILFHIVMYINENFISVNLIMHCKLSYYSAEIKLFLVISCIIRIGDLFCSFIYKQKENMHRITEKLTLLNLKIFFNFKRDVVTF